MCEVSQPLRHNPARHRVNPKGPRGSWCNCGGAEKTLSAAGGWHRPTGSGRAGRARRCCGRSGAEPAPAGHRWPGAGQGRAGPGGCREGRLGPRREQRDAVRGAGDQPAGRAAAAGAGADPVRRHRRHPGQTGRAGERDGAERAFHGAVGLGRALRAAGRLQHRRGGHGGAEPATQRPLLRRPDGAAGPRHRADCHPLLPTGALADRQEQDSHDVPVIP